MCLDVICLYSFSNWKRSFGEICRKGCEMKRDILGFKCYIGPPYLIDRY